MNTEQDARQIIDVILAAGELKRFGPSLISEITNAIALGSYSAGGFGESIDYEEDEYEDPYEAGLDDIIRRQEEGFIESEDEEYEEPVEYEEEEEEDLFVSAFSTETRNAANLAFRKNQQSNEDLIELNNVAQSLAQEAQNLISNNTYLRLVAGGDSDLENNVNNLLTYCNRFTESFTSLDEVNKGPLSTLISNGINDLNKKLRSSSDFSDRLQIIIDSYTESLVGAEEVPAPPEDQKDIREEIPGIRVDTGEEKDLIGPSVDEFLLQPEATELVSEWTRKTLDAYDSFERKNQDEFVDLFSPKKTSLSFDSGNFDVSKLDQLLDFIYNPSFPRLIYKDVTGLDDGKSFYEEIDLGNKDFLNFDGSVFYGKFESVSDAIGVNIIRSTSENSVLVELDNQKLKNIENIISNETYLIIEMIDRVYNFAVESLGSGISLQDLGAKVNLYRRLIAKKLDYLFGSIKRRDIEVITFVNKQDYLEDSDKDFIKKNCLISNILSQDGLFFRNKSLYEELIMRLVILLKPASSNNIFNNRKQRAYKDYNISWEEVLSSPFQDVLQSSVDAIIRKHLGSDALYKTTNISEDILGLSEKVLINKLEQQELSITTVTNIRTKCSVCGKLVYRDYKPVRRGGFKPIETRAPYDAMIYNPEKEIRYDIYSLVRADGTVISLNDLIGKSFEIGDEERSKLEEISKDYKRTDQIVDIKSWEAIEEDYYSGDSFKNIEAIIRKSHALKTLRGRLLSSNVPIYTSRIRCPFGKSVDVMKGKFDLDDSKKYATLSGVWDCGFSEELPQAQGLSLYLEDMVASRAIDEDTKNRLLNLSKAQAAGGFKFSSRSFICPEKINVPPDPNKAKDIIDDYSLIVMQSSWPKEIFSNESTEPGTSHPISQLTTEGESIISLRCGAKTSISQFDRDDFRNKIKELIDDENEDLYNNLISSMIELGVDVSDILPFTILKHSYSEVEDTDFSIDSSVIDNLLIRSSKISSLLKSAMATKTTKQREGQVDVSRFFDYVKDIKLTCHNNHSFSINESLSFANNYIDIPLTQARTKMVSTMIRRDAFNRSGQDQFDLLLSIKNGPIKSISRKRALEKGMKPYSEFLLGVDRISNIYFVNPGDPDGDFVYINTDNEALSIYPMFSEFMTASEAFVAEGGIVKSEYLSKLVAGVSASGSMSDAEEDPAAKALKNISSDRTIGERERGEIEAEGQKVVIAEIQRLNFIAIALIQNAIISIQELLLAATATNKEDVVFYGTKILKKTLEEKINSDFFSNKLSDLLNDIFNTDKYGISPEERGYILESAAGDRLASLSVEKIKQSIVEDLGENPRAFIYAIGSMFNRYLHRKIIEGVFSVARDFEDVALEADLNEIFIADKKLSVSQVASAIPSFVEPREIAEFERSLKLKPLPFTQDIQEKVDKLNAMDKFKNITEMWTGKQMVLAATAIYLSDRLADFCNKYLLKSSYKYLGYPLMPGFNLCTSEDVMSISIDDILTARAGALFTNPDIYDLQDKKELAEEMVSELIKLQNGAAYASRSSSYQERALDYIGDAYNALLTSSNVSDEDRAYISNLLTKVISNTRNVEVLLAPPDSGKYAEYFSRFENAHMLMPSMYHPVLLIPSKIVDKYVTESGQVIQRELQAEKQFSKPIYLIKDGKENFSYIFNISSDIALRGSFVLLASQSDVGLVKSLLPVEEAEDFESNNPQYFNNGWRLLYGNISDRDVKKAGLLTKKKSTQKEAQISICDHPGTFIFRDDDGNPVSYKNIDFGIDSQSGIAIGSYGRGAEACHMDGKFYPPLKDSIPSVGIPVPIQMLSASDIKAIKEGKVGKEDYGLYITLSDMPIDIPVDSGGMIRINLSDLLQRDPPEEANRILLEIEREYSAFLIEYNRLKNINPESAESKKEEFSSYARSKFNRYRNLPLKVVKNGFGRTSLDDAGRYNTTLGWYIPIVNPVIANTILTKACFGSEYAGAGIFSKAVYHDEEILSVGINAVQEFLVKINGYDKLASLFNSRKGMVNGEVITPLDLLDPYELLVSERSIDGRMTTRLSRKMLLGDSESARFVYDEESKSVEGIVAEKPSGRYAEIYKGELEAWKAYTPSFYGLNVGIGDDAGEANVGVPKLVIDTPIFRRKKMRDMSGVRSQDVGSDLLSTSDLTPLLMRESQEAGGVYNFAEVLQKFFSKKFKGIREFVEEYDSTPFDNKTAYFDSALLFNKVSSNILCSDFIKKSEKYQTKIFGRIMINDEAIRRLFD